MLNLNYNYLQTFKAVATYRNLTLASKNLHISQPSVSLTIRKLEESLGYRLFDRKSTGMELTAEGELLYKYVDDAFNMLNRGLKALDAMDDDEDMHLHITGSQSLICTRILPKLVAGFTEIHPKCRIRMHGTSTIKALHRLSAGLSDLALVYGPVQSGDSMTVEVVGETRVIFIGGPKYEDLSKKVSSVEELAECPLISYSASGQGRFFWNGVFGRNGLHPKAQYDVNSTEMLLSSVKMNLGIGLTLSQSAEMSLWREHIYELPVDIDMPKRDISFIYPTKERTSIANEFLDYVRETIGNNQLANYAEL